MALWTDKLAFYHCPCTGGTWVKSVLVSLGIPFRLEGYAHGTPAGNPPHKVVSFTVRRDPQQWLESWTKIKPPYAWPCPDWLTNAETVADAEAVFEHYAKGVDYVLELSDIRGGLQRMFDVVGIDKVVPDIPPTAHHVVYWPPGEGQAKAREKAKREIARLKGMTA